MTPPGSTSAPTTPPPAPPRPPAAGPLALGEAFGARYRILKVLGEGGMGVVYQAWDEELGVAVALKVVRPEVTADPEGAREVERRFKRELLLARQVTHKHVVRIHDLGEIDGVKYITMPFVEGEDLAHLLKREGQLPIGRTLAIARQVASGLAAAHEVGVVHRDLKPENVMIGADGQALIMDFGIARSVSGTGTATALGAVMGTLEYMAPEQAQGVAVDHRADIYAFGLMLYDMVAGRRRLAGRDNPMTEMMGRMQQAPPPLRSVEAAVPEGLDAVVSRCLQPDPAARYQATAELVAALGALDADGHAVRAPRAVGARGSRTPILALGGALAVVAAVAVWLAVRPSGPAPPPAQPSPVSILIANFKNETHDPVFDGLIEQALTVGVEGASFVTAFPRSDAIKLAEQLTPDKTLDENAARLVSIREGIDVTVGGSIARSGDRYKLAIQAVDPSNGKSILTWDTEAAGKDQVLSSVGKGAAKLRSALGDTTVGTRALNAETFTAGSLEAAHEYVQAQELQWQGQFDQAIQHYQKAVALDPDMGRAYAGLAAMYANLGRTQEAEDEYKIAMSKLDRMTEREKYRTRGGYYLLTRNWDRAIDELSALVKQYPADSAGLANLAVAYLYKRDTKRALAEGERASQIYPKNVIRRDNVALFAMYAGDFAKAEREAAEVLKLNPEFAKAFVATALSQLAQGNPDQAVATYRKLGELATGKTLAAYGLADVAMYQGRLADAASTIEAALKAPGLSPTATARLTVVLAAVRLGQGRTADAIREADAALAAAPRSSVRFLAGRVYLAAGREARAREMSAALDAQLGAEPRIFGKLIEGEIALEAGRARDALAAFQAAQGLADTWLGRVDMARAYLAAGAFTEASSELDRAAERQGEATAVFLDDIPSYHLYAAVLYYRARVQEGLKSPGAAKAYEAFLAIKANGDEQGLVADARRRLAALSH